MRIQLQQESGRVTTVTGAGVTNPLNIRARIGTTIGELVKLAGGYTDQARQMVPKLIAALDDPDIDANFDSVLVHQLSRR